MCCRSPTPHCTRHPLLAAHTLAPCHAPPLLHTAHISPLVTHSSAPRHALSRPSSHSLPPLATHSPTPRHALSRPSSHSLPPLVTHSPTPRHALSHPSSRTLPLLVKHIQLYHYDAATTTKPHHRIHTHLRNGPFHHAKRPISRHDSAHFRTRNGPFCNTLSISAIRQCTTNTRTRTSNFIKKNLRIHPNILTFAVANLSQAVKSDL